MPSEATLGNDGGQKGMTKDQPFAYFWMGSSFNVGGAGCPGQNTLEGHVFIGSFSCWRDRSSYQTVSKKTPR